MVCPRCGTQLISGSRVCMACGQNVTHLTSPSPATARPVSPAPSQTPMGLFNSNFTQNTAPVQNPAPVFNQNPAQPQSQIFNQIPVQPQSQIFNQTPVQPQSQTFNQTPAQPQSQIPTQNPAQPQSQIFNQTPVQPQSQTFNQTPAQPQSQTPTQNPASATPVVTPVPVQTEVPVQTQETVTPAPVQTNEVAKVQESAAPTQTPASTPAPVAEETAPAIETARTQEEIELLAKAKTGYSDKFIKKYANYWGPLASKLFDEESYEFVFGGVLNLDGTDDRIAGCGITQKRIIVTTTQGTVSYTYDKTKGVSSSKSLIGATVNIEIPRSKVKISVDKPYLDNIIKAIDEAIKKYHI